jgi:hypothetical protein
VSTTMMDTHVLNRGGGLGSGARRTGRASWTGPNRLHRLQQYPLGGSVSGQLINKLDGAKEFRISEGPHGTGGELPTPPRDP